MHLLEATATVEDVDAFVARLGAIEADHDVAIQAFDARYVVGRAHLERAVELADRAFERGANVARERSVEILLYAAGRRQINRALTMGVDEGQTPTVIVIHAPRADGDRAETAALSAVRDLESIDPAQTLSAHDPERVRAFFDVTEAELAATSGTLADIVLERVALLAVEK